MKKKICAALLAAVCALAVGCDNKMPERTSGTTSGTQSTLAANKEDFSDNFEFLCETENIKDGYKKYVLDYSKLKLDAAVDAVSPAAYDTDSKTIIAVVNLENGKATCEQIDPETYKSEKLFDFADGATYMDIILYSADVIVYREGFDEIYDYTKAKSVLFDRATGKKTVLAPYGTEEDDGSYNGVIGYAAIKGGVIYYDNFVFDDIAQSYSFTVETLNTMNGEHEVYENNAVMPLKYRDTIAYMSYVNGMMKTDEMYQNDENIVLLNQQYANNISCDDTTFTFSFYDYETQKASAKCIYGGTVKDVVTSKNENAFIESFVCASGKGGLNLGTVTKPFYYDTEKNLVKILDGESADYYRYCTYDGGIIAYASGSDKVTILII